MQGDRESVGEDAGAARAAAPRTSPLGTLLDSVAVAAILAAVVWSLFTYARLPLTRPSIGDYSAAAAFVRERFRDGDLVDVHPFYLARPREMLGDLPIAGFRHVEREDLSRYRRLWLLSAFGAEKRDAVERGLGQRYALAEQRRFGRLDVRLYELPEPARVLFDFREHLDHALVWIDRGTNRIPCGVWETNRWRCDRSDWNYVGREIFEMQGQPREVVFAHPVGWGVKTIEFLHVPAGREIAGEAGLRPFAARHGGAAVTLTIAVDRVEVLRRAFPADAELGAFRADTSKFAGVERTVTFTVTAPDDGARHFAFRAEARE
jgi:hypothetical protein